MIIVAKKTANTTQSCWIIEATLLDIALAISLETFIIESFNYTLFLAYVAEKCYKVARQNESKNNANH